MDDIRNGGHWLLSAPACMHAYMHACMHAAGTKSAIPPPLSHPLSPTLFVSLTVLFAPLCPPLLHNQAAAHRDTIYSLGNGKTNYVVFFEKRETREKYGRVAATTLFLLPLFFFFSSFPLSFHSSSSPFSFQPPSLVLSPFFLIVLDSFFFFFPWIFFSPLFFFLSKGTVPRETTRAGDRYGDLSFRMYNESFFLPLSLSFGEVLYSREVRRPPFFSFLSFLLPPLLATPFRANCVFPALSSVNVPWILSSDARN